MSTKPDETAAAPPKSKKMLVVVVLVVLVIALAGIAAFVYVGQQRAAAQFDDEERPVAKHVQTGPPTYLPLDNMVVNLADPGGERVAQIGVTLELLDASASDKVKQYLPTIRSGILMLMSQRTSVELLQREGKERLARDILREASRPFGGIDEAEGQDLVEPVKGSTEKKSDLSKAPPVDRPVQRVLFSSFIVQ